MDKLLMCLLKLCYSNNKYIQFGYASFKIKRCLCKERSLVSTVHSLVHKYSLYTLQSGSVSFLYNLL